MHASLDTSNSAEKRSMHAEELHGETAETTDTATEPSRSRNLEM